MTVYTTILANYLFWIAQYRKISLWSLRYWQHVGMWVVQWNRLEAEITLDSGRSSCSLSALTLAALPSPLLWATSTTDFAISSVSPYSVLAELCWTWQPRSICVAVHVGAEIAKGGIRATQPQPSSSMCFQIPSCSSQLPKAPKTTETIWPEFSSIYISSNYSDLGFSFFKLPEQH